MPFLTDIQIENLLYYTYKYGPLVEIYELKNVENLDYRTLNYLLPFVFVGEIKPVQQVLRSQNLRHYAKQTFMLRSDYTIQQKAGYKKTTEEEVAAHPNKYYLGEPYYLSFRYGYQYQDWIQIGISGEKDAGEAFWNKNHKGFDYYAFNLNIKNQGILENLHVGDYRLSFGQGLVMNNNFSMGKTSFVGSINQNNSGIKRHVSTNENGAFRGLAGALKFNDWQINLFYSHRNHDANADSSNIYTFKTDGYNRIPNDINKRRTAQINMGGTHIRWRTGAVNLGLTAVYYAFGGKMLNPEPKAYNLFYLRAKNHFNAGVNYGYRTKKISFQGETARDANGKWATVNNLLVNPASSVDLIFSYRNYARDYNAFYGESFSESSTVQNETGFYTGIKFYPFSKWELSAYMDYFRFPWLKYGINAPSSGTDGLLQISYKRNDQVQMSLRYKYKEKSKNSIQADGRETFVLPYYQHRWRYQLDLKNRNGFGTKTQADYNLYPSGDTPQTGWSLTQNFSFSRNKSGFQIDGALAYFHASDWNTRINIYEKNILYAFSFPNYYGEGFRLYSVIKWKIFDGMTLYLKIANTHYFDREIIGSGLEEIEGKNKTDMAALLKYNF
ncbi:MAG: helix-hairpin-helix domain-containing protein [Candidatus Symbiothrix sp.]|nr:helix-hairpin-helix domain-containing protein [Candidatus Symbiothrix sp.]